MTCVTFDQPLWLKATGIIEESNLAIVARLGGFHTVMSFLGVIGNIMKSSGLEVLLAEVYAEHSVEHILSGKAVSRALRAHFLVESCLTSLFQKIQENNFVDLTPMQDFIDALDGSKSLKEIDQFCQSKEVNVIEKALKEKMDELQLRSRTAKLWLLYLHYIKVLKLYIIAERTSNWQLHLQTSDDMLNLFAACGHINYAKSARLYIQQMATLNK